MKVATAQISYVGSSQELVLDTSIKSGTPGYGVLLAPTWGIVMGHKHKKISWAEYQASYTLILRSRYETHRDDFMTLAREERVVVFKCYCNAKVKPCCHRYLLVGVFESICQRSKLPFEYIGELR